MNAHFVGVFYWNADIHFSKNMILKKQILWFETIYPFQGTCNHLDPFSYGLALSVYSHRPFYFGTK